MRTPIARPNSRERLTHLAAILQPSRRAVLVCPRRASVHSASCTSGTPARRMMGGNSAQPGSCPRAPLVPRQPPRILQSECVCISRSVELMLAMLVAPQEARSAGRGAAALAYYHWWPRPRHHARRTASAQQRAPRRLCSARCRVARRACSRCDGSCVASDSERQVGEARTARIWCSFTRPERFSGRGQAQGEREHAPRAPSPCHVSV